MVRFPCGLVTGGAADAVGCERSEPFRLKEGCAVLFQACAESGLSLQAGRETVRQVGVSGFCVCRGRFVIIVRVVR